MAGIKNCMFTTEEFDNFKGRLSEHNSCKYCKTILSPKMSSDGGEDRSLGDNTGRNTTK